MSKITGIGASNGIALAKAYRLVMPDLTTTTATVDDVDGEVAKFKAAVEKTNADLMQIKEVASANLSAEEAAVFDAHALMLGDPEFQGQIEAKIKDEKLNGGAAIEQVAATMSAMFEAIPDAYFQERAADVKDVSRRLLANFLGKPLPNPTTISEDVIIVADDLTPSDTAQLNKYVKGFATNIGGRTSHSAIMARSLEIPAVVSCKTITDDVKDGDFLALNGIEGVVIINPSDDEIKDFEAKRDAFIKEKEELKKLVNEKTISTDGHKVELVANIGGAGDLPGAHANGAEGVGLFRTEFLYMESADLPTEDRQYDVYKEVLEDMKGKPVVVRTLDIGGDKKIDAIELPDEMNPFLGVRAVRLCFQREDIFRTQLRALLRASVHGDLRIMFPMIATVAEFRKAKGILMEEKEKLVKEGIPVSDTFQVGIMIEIPAAAVIADKLAKEVDFFSIGTNDLIQYTFAADRMSTGVSYLYQPFNPSILRLVRRTIACSHAEGKWTGMCGEMAGEHFAGPLLLGLGLDEFSMSATSVLAQRKLIKSVSYEECKKLADACCDECATMEEVVDKVKAFLGE